MHTLITEYVVMDDYYYDSRGLLLQSMDMLERIIRKPYNVYTAKGIFIGKVIQIRNMGGRLEALIEE